MYGSNVLYDTYLDKLVCVFCARSTGNSYEPILYSHLLYIRNILLNFFLLFSICVCCDRITEKFYVPIKCVISCTKNCFLTLIKVISVRVFFARNPEKF